MYVHEATYRFEETQLVGIASQFVGSHLPAPVGGTRESVPPEYCPHGRKAEAI